MSKIPTKKIAIQKKLVERENFEEENDNLPPYGWQELVSNGHTLGFRVRAMIKPLHNVAWLCAIGATVTAVSMLYDNAISKVTRQPQQPAYIQKLLHDPEKYIHLSSGEDLSYRSAWIAGISNAGSGMPNPQFMNLVGSAYQDITNAGLDSTRYANLTEYKTKFQSEPSFTKASKSLTPKYVQQLSSGVIALPDNGQPSTFYVLANVEGSLTIVQIGQNGCREIIGTELSANCQKVQNAEQFLTTFKPAN